METADKKTIIANRIFYSVILLLIVGSVFLAYYKYGIKKDFLLYVKGNCDPKVESCFNEVCVEDDRRCLHFAADGVNRFYKIIFVKNNSVPLCNIDDEKCIDEFCVNNNKDCLIYNCSEAPEKIKNKLLISDECSQ